MQTEERSSIRPSINVAPLVDIVLVLLIVFIVITPAVRQGVQLPVAKHAEQCAASAPTLICQALKDVRGKAIGLGTVLIQEADGGHCERIHWEDAGGRSSLQSRIHQNLDGKLDRRVILNGDSDLLFKHIYGLIEVCREGGADEVSIVTEITNDTMKGGRS